MINLFINPFKNIDRQHEFDECLRRNEQNQFIDNIILVKENGRATFQEFFWATREYPNDINIIANLDIYFDDSIQLASQIQENECYALTRWEDCNGTIMSFTQRHPEVPAKWSQDAWIFKGAIMLAGFHEVTAVNQHQKSPEKIPFTMGIPGSDNKLAVMLKTGGYNVTNPSFTIRAIHLHNTDYRDYGKYQILSGIKSYPFGDVKQSSL